MKKFFTTLIAIILIVAMAGAFFVFVFDKKIPTKWASAPIEAAKNDKFPSNDNLPKVFKLTYEEISYSKDSNNKVVTTYDIKAFRQISNKSTEDAEAYEVKNIDYNTNGQISEEYIARYYIEDGIQYVEDKNGKMPTDFSVLKAGYYIAVADFYQTDLSLKTDIQIMIDSNLDYVTQKGLGVTLHLVKDNESINLTYSLIAKRIVRLEKTVDTYTDNVLSKRIHQVVEF